MWSATASSGHGRSPGGWGQRGTCEMQGIPTVVVVAACNYDSDNAKIMFQSRTHNLEFQLIGEKPENSNIYVCGISHMSKSRWKNKHFF